MLLIQALELVRLYGTDSMKIYEKPRNRSCLQLPYSRNYYAITHNFSRFVILCGTLCWIHTVKNYTVVVNSQQEFPSVIKYFHLSCCYPKKKNSLQGTEKLHIFIIKVKLFWTITRFARIG